MVGKREAQKNYVNIIMEDVIIKSVVTGGGIDDSFFKEHLTLVFDRITFECNRPLNDGNDKDNETAGEGNDFRWDVIGNSKWIKA
jgi:type VI protein secretion system component Hcp